jgi:hypothetical protein
VEDWSEFVTPQWLVRRVVLDEYLADRYLPVAKRASAEHAISVAEATRVWVEAKKPPLEAIQQPGDEWWEWLQGSEPLMQMGGLALVRSGAVVWASMDWMS